MHVGRGRIGAVARIAIALGLLAGFGFMPAEGVSAQEHTVHVLLSADPGAPSAAAIVEGFDFSAGGTPPLAGMAAESAVDAQYLVPKRASGAFAEYLASHPNTPRARLERYIVIRYSDSSNLVAARNALLADPDVEHAHIPAQADFTVPASPTIRNAVAATIYAQSQASWRTSLGRSGLRKVPKTRSHSGKSL